VRGMYEYRDQVKVKLQEFTKHGAKFERALDAVLAGGVKECTFSPSGKKIMSVVGRYGDEFIDPDRPFCSCGDFFFRVARGKGEVCYHLLSWKVAVRLGLVDIIKFDDSEYDAYLAAAVRDGFEVIGRSAK
jgi:predicted nucleic acid-binding Zn finger protein